MIGATHRPTAQASIEHNINLICTLSTQTLAARITEGAVSYMGWPWLCKASKVKKIRASCSFFSRLIAMMHRLVGSRLADI